VSFACLSIVHGGVVDGIYMRCVFRSLLGELVRLIKALGAFSISVLEVKSILYLMHNHKRLSDVGALLYIVCGMCVCVCVCCSMCVFVL
jgi:hypothetical protein